MDSINSVFFAVNHAAAAMLWLPVMDPKQIGITTIPSQKWE
jgi:hypothetical protein